jgi:fatty-acid desaturase
LPGHRLLSCQHGPIDWVVLHRHHQKFSDTDADHHDSSKGFWWSHMGWMLVTVPALATVPRLTGDLATGAGGWALVLRGIPLRLVLNYHITWLVNSATQYHLLLRPQGIRRPDQPHPAANPPAPGAGLGAAGASDTRAHKF